MGSGEPQHGGGECRHNIYYCPFSTGCVPLNYSGNPGVNAESYRGGNGNRLGQITISPGPFLTPWRDAAAAIVDFGFPGEQEGNAVVDVLFGTVNPGGKLPHTMPNTANEMRMTPRQYPGTPPPPDDDEIADGKATGALTSGLQSTTQANHASKQTPLTKPAKIVSNSVGC